MRVEVKDTIGEQGRDRSVRLDGVLLDNVVFVESCVENAGIPGVVIGIASDSIHTVIDCDPIVSLGNKLYRLEPIEEGG